MMPPTARPVLVAILLLAGCSIDQAKEVQRYRALLDAGAPALAYSPGEPLTLETALLLASRHNEELGLRGEDYLQALIDKDRAAAAFVPTISLAPTYFAQDPDPTASSFDDEDEDGAGGGTGGGGGGGSAGGGSRGGTSRDRRFDFPVNARLERLGLGDLAAFRAAGRTIEQRRAQLLDAQAVVLLDVARTYFQVLRAQRSADVLRGSLALQEARLREARVRVAAGFLLPLDIAQTEAQVAATRVALIAAGNDAANAREILSALIGVPVGRWAGSAPDLLEPPDLPAPPPDLEAAEQLALAHRQDLAAARFGIEAARRAVDAALAQYYPSVSLNFNYFFTRDSNPSESQWNALLGANLPLLTAGRIHADVRSAWSRYRQARLVESATHKAVVRDVAIARNDLTSSDQRLAELAVQLRAAQEALSQADQVYKQAGRGTYLDVLVAQDRLLSTQLQSASARFDRKVAELNLLRAMGQLSTRLPWEPATPPATTPATTPATNPATNPGTGPGR
jgi:outer membrane protein TolC